MEFESRLRAKNWKKILVRLLQSFEQNMNQENSRGK